MGSNYFLLNVDNGDLFKVGKFFDNTKTKSIGFDKMDRGLPDHFVSATIDALSFFLASSVGCRLTTISFSELEKYLHLAFVEWMKENPTDSDGVAHWSVIGDPVSMAKLYQTRRYNNYKNNAKPLPPELVGAELKNLSNFELEILSTLKMGIRISTDEIGKVVPIYEFGDQVTRHVIRPYWVERSKAEEERSDC